jgi:hypothetical protein
MTDLEKEVAELRARLDVLAERVRLDAVAEAFIAGRHEIREGDYFLRFGDHHATRLNNISSDGKWTYDSTEWGRDQTNLGHKRLYTIEEVAEILAKSKRL